MKNELFLQHLPLFRWILFSGLAASIVTIYIYHISIAISVFVGVLFMLGSQYLMLQQINNMETGDNQQGQKKIMMGAAKRFIAMILFLIIAHYIGLHLLAVAAGLAIAYFNLYAYSAAALFRN